MQEQFTYRELSEKLNINLAKLKRWGREFLPPDVSAGQSQGVARILTIDEAFILYISGELVGFLKYSIHDSKIILAKISPWIKKKKIMPSLCFKTDKHFDWIIEIRYDSKHKDYYFVAKGVYEKHLFKTISKKDSDYHVFKRKEISHYFVERIFPELKNRDKVIHYFTKREFYISVALSNFLHHFGSNGESQRFIDMYANAKIKFFDKE